MSIHVCRCEHNGVQEFHLRYPGMPEDRAQHLADRINAGWLDGRESPADRIAALEGDLERERMRLAACAVVALADTQATAATARDMHADYRSASCDDVARQVDECMRLRDDLARVTAERDALREDAERWRDLLTSIRCDIQCLHWHKDIDAAIGAARKEGGCEVKIKGEKS